MRDELLHGRGHAVVLRDLLAPFQRHAVEAMHGGVDALEAEKERKRDSFSVRYAAYETWTGVVCANRMASRRWPDDGPACVFCTVLRFISNRLFATTLPSTESRTSTNMLREQQSPPAMMVWRVPLT